MSKNIWLITVNPSSTFFFSSGYYDNLIDMGRYGNTVGSRVNLSYQQATILVGKVLGDGCLEKNGLHVRLKIEQADQQKDYVDWLYQQFQPFVCKAPAMLDYGGANRKITRRWRFATRSLEIFDCYHQLFYPRGKKLIPSNIVDFLKHPLTLAVWYMDDGYLRTDRSGAYLCTSSFSTAEHLLLQKALLSNYGLHAKTHFAAGYARLHIPSRDKEHFMRTIKPYILPCFKYKLL